MHKCTFHPAEQKTKTNIQHFFSSLTPSFISTFPIALKRKSGCGTACLFCLIWDELWSERRGLEGGSRERCWTPGEAPQSQIGRTQGIFVLSPLLIIHQLSPGYIQHTKANKWKKRHIWLAMFCWYEEDGGASCMFALAAHESGLGRGWSVHFISLPSSGERLKGCGGPCWREQY